MKVFVDVLPATLSRAMHRVAGALRRYAPPEVTIAYRPNQADVQLLHAIGPTATEFLGGANSYAVIQYCAYTGAVDSEFWWPLLAPSKLVWSYYDLAAKMPPGVPFHRSPLGVDDIFVDEYKLRSRDIGAMTSGYVTGWGQEAIEEVAIAAERVGKVVAHLGPPNIVGAKKPFGPHWTSIFGVNDMQLAQIYCRTQYVSGLRYVEGFELPVIEGLVSGARPIVFDRPDMRVWFDGHAEFVRESEGEELIEQLVAILGREPRPVSEEERQAVIARFNWKTIVQDFYAKLLEAA